MGVKNAFDTVGSVASSLRVQAASAGAAANTIRLLPLPAVLQLSPQDAGELASLVLEGLGDHPDAEAIRAKVFHRFCTACGSRVLPCYCTRDD